MAFVAACGEDAEQSPALEEARPFADDFVRRLVVDGRWNSIEGD